MPQSTVLYAHFSSFFEQVTDETKSLFSRLQAAVANNRNSKISSNRMSRFVRSQDARGEKWVALAQGGLATFILFSHIVVQVGENLVEFKPWVELTLIALVVASGVRYVLSRQKDLPHKTLHVLNVLDVAIFFVLIWSYQFEYGHDAGAILKAPTFVILFVLVSLRVLRFDPVPLLVTGAAAILGWIMLVALVIAKEGLDAITHDYGAYLLTHKVLIGAEVEKLTALVCLVIIISVAAHRVRDGILQFDEVLEHMPQGVAMFDKNKCLVICNRQYGDLYGLDAEHVKPGTTVAELLEFRQNAGVYGDDEATATFTSDWLDGFLNAQSKVQELSDGRVFSVRRERNLAGGIVTTTEDITDRRRLEARIEHMAYHDALTGLANRIQLKERLEKMLAGRRARDGIAALCVDLDHFKEVNDTLGHPVGDALLMAVADRLRDTVREHDFVARTGGDEFVILQTQVDTPNDASALSSRVIKVLSAPYELKGHQVIIGASVGLSFSNGQNVEAEELIKQADIALYRAKESGRGAFCFYEEDMNERLQARRTMERDLRKALMDEEFELYYQPVINVAQDGIRGVEALIRWHHPERGMVSPGEFIPLVEEMGLAIQLGEWVIRQACSDAANWSDDIKVSVNVSPLQFRKPGLVNVVHRAIESSGLLASRLELEITESALLDNSDGTIKILNELRDSGVRVAMDDFGTGYASLSYLQRFPFDRIKIDRSFVNEMMDEGSACEIVKSVISLAKGLGMETTAEGVETAEQLESIKAEGCTDIQGFFTGRPMPRAELEKLLTA